ncbi:methyltransferase domain-containing protein [Streptomyces sp. NPDC057616]|uniref:methyltransferase domain-containing protein n=1 Tax=Streptomyces sp. NPDC057616 TaxID=3346183 RepID=UPI00368E534D
MNSLRTRLSAVERHRRHRSAARAIHRLLPEPESWLDVGTGEAHFPEAARKLFPYTSIDGLDPGPRVAYARHLERIEEAYAGHVTDRHITAILRGRYDVVTLLDRRSPVPDPRTELPAALTLLRPGGLLLVEAAAQESYELRRRLEERDCTIVAASRHVLDRLPYTYRIIARRTVSAA